MTFRNSSYFEESILEESTTPVLPFILCMQTVALAAEGACSRSCRRCGRTLRSRFPSLSTSRSFHSTPYHRDDQDLAPHDDEPHDEHYFRPRLPRRRETEAEKAAKLRSDKLNLSKKFTLAEEGAQSGALILKNYRIVGSKPGKHDTEKVKLPERPYSREVNAFAAELQDELEIEEARREHRAPRVVSKLSEEASEEEVNEQIEQVREDIRKRERELDHQDEKKEQKLARQAGDPRQKHERRAAKDRTPNVIRLETYMFFHKNLRQSFTQEQLENYANNYLSNADRKQYAGAADVSGLLLSSQGIHSGWRPTDQAWREADRPVQGLRYTTRGRTKRSVADQIIRVLWKYEVKQEIELSGELHVKVPEHAMPLLSNWTRQHALALLGTPPNVKIDLARSSDIIIVTGAKYDCFEARKRLKLQMAEIGIYELPLDVLKSDVHCLASGKKPDFMEAIAQDMGCKIVERDEGMSVLGATKSEAYACGQAILSELQLRATNSYRVMMENTVAHDTVRLLPDPRSTEALSFRARHSSTGRIVSDRVVANDDRVSEAGRAANDNLMRTFSSAHETFTAIRSITDTNHDLKATSQAEDTFQWTPTRSFTAEIGKVLSTLSNFGNKDPGKPLARTRLERAFQDRKHALRFAPSIAGLPQMLDSTLKETERTTQRFRRLRLYGRLPEDSSDTVQQPPMLEIDVQKGSVFRPIAARLLQQEDVVDVLLPHLPHDVRFGAVHQFEANDAKGLAELVDFVGHIRVSAGGWRSPEVLRLSVPVSSFTSTQATTSSKDLGKSSTSANTEEDRILNDMGTSSFLSTAIINVDFLPVSFESVETVAFPYRGHLLEVTRIDGGRFGVNVEKITLRYLDETIDRATKHDAPVSDIAAASSTSPTPIPSENQDSIVFSDTDAEDADAMASTTTLPESASATSSATSVEETSQDRSVVFSDTDEDNADAMVRPSAVLTADPNGHDDGQPSEETKSSEDKSRSFLRALVHLTRRLDKGMGHLEVGKFGS